MIRPLEAADWEAWKPLWDGYLRFYREPLPDEITEATFRRLCSHDGGMRGLLAVEESGGAAVGLAHMIFHSSTWTTAPYCYLEDLFVAPSARGGNVGRALIEAVYHEADAAGAGRVYWHTQQYNAPARSLYDSVGSPTSFIVYERGTGG